MLLHAGQKSCSTDDKEYITQTLNQRMKWFSPMRWRNSDKMSGESKAEGLSVVQEFKKTDFEKIFNPRGVAVVGASSDPSKFGFIFYYGLKEAGANVYPVNPKEREILGDKVYPTVDQIPYEVDYALISIPADKVPKVIKDCGKKGVKAVGIFTAGYSENGTEDGRKRERELAEVAKRNAVRVIGPNCIGICCPKGRLVFFPGLPIVPGDVTFLSQSGGHAEEFSYKAEGWGIRFSKIVSFGNACDVTCEELLEYLGEDPETKIIGVYIEGTKNGRKFFEVLKRVAKQKPVVIWKGGETEAGVRATVSHTGSLAGSPSVWDAVIRQAGAIKVGDFEEFMDTICALEYLPVPRGRRAAIIGAGGGAAVSATDICEKNYLKVVPFSEETRKKLDAIIPPLGTNVKNPIDLSYFLVFNFSLMKDCVEIVAADPNIDILIAHISHLDMLIRLASTMMIEDAIFPTLIEIKKAMRRFPEKPAALVLSPSASLDVEMEKIKLREKLVNERFCVYPTMARAAKALANLAYLREVREMR